MTQSEYLAELVADITTYCTDDPDFNAGIAEVKAKTVLRELIMRRNYDATSLKGNAIYDDAYKFYSTVLNVSIYDYNHTGAEGEILHAEGGDRRQWEEREKLWYGVHAFVNCLS